MEQLLHTKLTQHDIVKYANFSKQILEDNTDYLSSKKLISTFFEDKSVTLNIDTVMLRLTIIDSIYSTQMNKRLFGLKELAEAILNLAKKDIDLVNKLKYFLENNTDQDEIVNILIKQFGISKNGKKGGVATSLLSKYFYFILDYQFPIYDSLVQDNLKEIANQKFNFNEKFQYLKDTNKRIEFFKLLIKFNNTSKINDFNILDNLCWLYGKVKKGSYSLLIGKNEYLKLIERIDVEEVNESRKTSSLIDDKIRNYLKSGNKSSSCTLIDKILGENLYKFITELEI